MSILQYARRSTPPRSHAALVWCPSLVPSSRGGRSRSWPGTTSQWWVRQVTSRAGVGLSSFTCIPSSKYNQHKEARLLFHYWQNLIPKLLSLCENDYQKFGWLEDLLETPNCKLSAQLTGDGGVCWWDFCKQTSSNPSFRSTYGPHWAEDRLDGICSVDSVMAALDDLLMRLEPTGKLQAKSIGTVQWRPHWKNLNTSFLIDLIQTEHSKQCSPVSSPASVEQSTL